MNCTMSEDIEVNGKKVSKEEFQEMVNNSNIRLTEISPNCFKKLERLKG